MSALRHKKVFVTPLIFSLFLTIFLLAINCFAEENESTTHRIIQIERNRLYMIYLGTKDGAKEGDTIEIVGDGVKKAELRLVSILRDSSVAQVVAILDPAGILESDTARFTKPKRPAKRRPKKAPLAEGEPEPPKKKPKVFDEQLAKQLAAKEAQWQKKLQAVKKEYHEKLVRQEDAAKEKLASQEQQSQEKIDTLSSELSQLKDKTSKLTTQLKDKESFMNFLTNEVDEKEKQVIKSNDAVSDLREELKSVRASAAKKVKSAKQPLEQKIGKLNTELKMLKKDYKEKLKLAEKQAKERSAAKDSEWQAKLASQKQEIQQKTTALNNKAAFLETSVTKLTGDIKNKESFIRSLTAQLDQLDQKDREIAALNKTVSSFREKLKSTKASTSKKLRPLQEKVNKLASEIATLKKDYEQKLKLSEKQAKEELAAKESQWQKKLGEVKKDYEQKLKLAQRQAKGELVAKETQWQKKLGEVEEKLNLAQRQTRGKLAAKERQWQKKLGEVKKDYKLAEKQAKEDLASKNILSQAKLSSLKQEMQQKITALENEVAQLKESIAKLTEQSKTKESTIVSLANRLDEREKQIANLSETLSNLREDLKSTKTSVSRRLRFEKQPLQQKISKLNSEITGLRKDYAEKLKLSQKRAREGLVTKESEWLKKLDEARKHYEEKLASQKQEMQQQIDTFVNKITELKDATNELSAQLKDKESFIGSFATELSHVHQKDKEIAALNKTVSNLREEVKSTKASMRKKIMSERQPFQAKIEKLSLEITTLKKHHEEKLRLAEKQAREGLAAKDIATRAKLSSQEQEMQQKITALQNEVAELKESTAKVTEQVKIKESTLGSLGNQLDQKEKQIANLSKTISNLRQDLKSTKASVPKKIRFEKQPLQAKIEKLSSQITFLKKDYEEKLKLARNQAKDELTAKDIATRTKLFSQKQQMQQKITALENEFAELKESTAKLAEQVKLKESFIGSLTAELGQLDRKAKPVANLNETIVRLKKELKTTKDSVPNKIRVAKQPLQEKIDKLNTELASLKKYYQEKINLSEKQAKKRLIAREKQWRERFEALKKNRRGKVSTVVSLDNLSKYSEKEGRDYYSTIRGIVLNNVRETALSRYEHIDKIGSVEIQFQLLSNGYLEGKPTVSRVRDKNLIDIIHQGFEKALPFPPFPESLNRSSQQFVITLLFESR